MTETDKLLVRIGTARDAISMKTEHTSLDYMIDGVLMNCSVLLKEQDDMGKELTDAMELIRKKNERIEKLLKEQKFLVDSDGKITPLPVVVRCKDCKHRPIKPNDYENGFDLEFPDGKCPCQCDDGWYSWYPPDDWFCANGKHK